MGVAVDSSNNVFFTDTFNRVVRKVDSTGTITTIGGDPSQFANPATVPALSAQLGEIGVLATDPSGQLLIADGDHHTVGQISLNGQYQVIAGDNLQKAYSGQPAQANAVSISPAGVAADSSGNVYISSFAYHRVIRVSPDGQATVFAGSGSAASTGDGGLATDAGVLAPQGLAFDNAGNLYIAELGGNRIRKVAPHGTITTFA